MEQGYKKKSLIWIKKIRNKGNEQIALFFDYNN